VSALPLSLHLQACPTDKHSGSTWYWGKSVQCFSAAGCLLWCKPGEQLTLFVRKHLWEEMSHSIHASPSSPVLDHQHAVTHQRHQSRGVTTFSKLGSNSLV